jgi:hypothetical protein
MTGMRIFGCPTCGQIVYYDNLACINCGAELAYSRRTRAMVALRDDGEFRDDGGLWRRCLNSFAGCNWLVSAGDESPECYSCLLTRQRPTEGDDKLYGYLIETTQAKRWLVFQLDELSLPIVSHRDRPEGGLAFDLDATTDDRRVMIGHMNGVISIDLTEAQDSHREALRVALGEAYRTMLGHFRHEIGHYYWQAVLEPSAEWLAGFRERFGDERQDYGQALNRHYGSDKADDWRDAYISNYATTHPWEDFAETFAHYLHITDTAQTAAAFGVGIDGLGGTLAETLPGFSAHPSIDVATDAPFRDILNQWQPLALALNQVNRSLGKDDLYPFVIPEPVVQKLEYVHALTAWARAAGRSAPSPS